MLLTGLLIGCGDYDGQSAPTHGGAATCLEDDAEGSGVLLPDQPPTTAIDGILKNNVNVKKCFFYHQKDNGTLRKRRPG